MWGGGGRERGRGGLSYQKQNNKTNHELYNFNLVQIPHIVKRVEHFLLDFSLHSSNLANHFHMRCLLICNCNKLILNMESNWEGQLWLW